MTKPLNNSNIVEDVNSRLVVGVPKTYSQGSSLLPLGIRRGAMPLKSRPQFQGTGIYKIRKYRQ